MASLFFKTISLGVALTLSLADDRITSLPGYSSNQPMYSGYVNVNVSHGRNLFYWFVESSVNPDTSPLVLWTNGGPGCSSLSGGLFSEFGPFFPNADGSLSLTPNMWTWTQAANVIFIEQPAGVGFSYSDTPSDYTTGDYQSSQDVLAFMLGFLARYPQYANRPFFISGESYGGHYVPSFANAIVRSNLAGVNPKINIQGFIAGNAWTVAELDNIGAITYWYTRTMIDNATYNGILSTCNMSDVGPLLAKQTRDESEWEIAAGITAPPRPLGFTPLLDKATGKAKVSSGQDCDGWTNQGFNLISGIDIYDSFSDVCTVSSPPSSSATKSVSVSSSLSSGSNNNAGCALDYDPCRDGKTTTYLNDPLVKSLIHANASIVWTGCSDIVDYSRFDLLSSMLPVYEFLISQGLRISVYSGDVDAIVPTVGTREWIAALGVSEVAPIRPWTVNGQVGGWTTQFNGLNFTTIRNAGHFVPEMQGERALKFFKAFLNNEAL